MKNEVAARVVFCTFPDAETARKIATELVELQLAACVNLVPGVESIYRWEGKVERENEILGIVKTIEPALEKLETTLTDLHPYDVPEFLVLPVEAASEKYLTWLAQEILPSR